MSIYFDGIKCSSVDLHENYFSVTEWRYKVDSPFKNNLYFGYNGIYKYYFNAPGRKYVLDTYEKYRRENFIINNLDINEKDFLEKLQNQIKKDLFLISTDQT